MKSTKKLIAILLTLILVSPINTVLADSVTDRTNVDKNFIVPTYIKNSAAENQIRQMLSEEGASSETIEVLINKLKHGELWDSFKPEYKNLKPQIDTPTYKKTIYPDGSIVVCGIKENDYVLSKVDDLHYEYDVQIYKNTMVINAYFTINYVRDTVSNTAKITYQSTPVVTIWDVSGYGQAYDLQYDREIGWKNPTCAWVSFYPMGSIMGEKCWLRGYANGNGHWIDYEY